MAAQKKGLGRGLDALLDPYSVALDEPAEAGVGENSQESVSSDDPREPPDRSSSL